MQISTPSIIDSQLEIKIHLPFCIAVSLVVTQIGQGLIVLGYRRGWATYQSTYLFAKLSTLVIIALIDPDNCFFRSLPRTPIPIVRQIVLLVFTIGFFLAQCFFAPFLDPVNNANEWTSRLNYVTTSIVALLLALNVPRQEIYNVYILYMFVWFTF